ncbi:hypothetical protein ACQKJC_24665 [Priestia koreensis]|uniref:hypothetical protein n=1 Tax=Priestia koreensis TaxID=284581 RepID=UPI003D026F41
MKLNQVNTEKKNLALVSLINGYDQILPIDTNFIIPPDRSKTVRNCRAIPFGVFQRIWIKPLITTFPYLAIHESVHTEINSTIILKYVDNLINGTPPSLILLSDTDLTHQEEVIRSTIEQKIAVQTNYDPIQDNKTDRGEVKSLSYIATKSLLYFCSHDSNAIRLIECADKFNTNLEDVNAIRTYEIIYYLLKMQMSHKDDLRMLYRYLYYLSPSDKKSNPSWNEFVNDMDALYGNEISQSKNKPIPLILNN